ncbi:unnamed protein product [Vitrella brassicaformis CCMP3155]|uniref:CULT domain-containing protein n=1 Tax=Vitrella brassicaformis (strain CCMP3155) TaxID=1169540 RepID=A0A0G4G937_VITBC|nr:unnamed protein product [Vitrella brassicaformis CCMP3155]|eukprot:CEM25337.1 unnamed protein product [Vitrella brassicaformis CCMP3155]
MAPRDVFRLFLRSLLCGLIFGFALCMLFVGTILILVGLYMLGVEFPEPPNVVTLEGQHDGHHHQQQQQQHDLECKSCGTAIGRSADLYPPREVGGVSSFVAWQEGAYLGHVTQNIGGVNTTVYTFQQLPSISAKRLRFRVVRLKDTTHTNLRKYGPSHSDSWFPAYRWTIAVCPVCGRQIGWHFSPKAVSKHNHQEAFYAINLDAIRNHTHATRHPQPATSTYLSTSVDRLQQKMREDPTLASVLGGAAVAGGGGMAGVSVAAMVLLPTAGIPSPFIGFNLYLRTVGVLLLGCALACVCAATLWNAKPVLRARRRLLVAQLSNEGASGNNNNSKALLQCLRAADTTRRR